MRVDAIALLFIFYIRNEIYIWKLGLQKLKNAANILQPHILKLNWFSIFRDIGAEAASLSSLTERKEGYIRIILQRLKSVLFYFMNELQWMYLAFYGFSYHFHYLFSSSLFKWQSDLLTVFKSSISLYNWWI